MKLIERPKYNDRLKSLRGTPDIKILTGIRRCGKSELLRSFARYIKSENPSANIIFIDFTSLDFEHLLEYHSLYQYINDHYCEGVENVVMIDEVQMCPKFELAVNSLHSSYKYDIYLTGSNAFLMSNDLATLFTGRHIEIHVFPFSFDEYRRYYDDITDSHKLLERYVVEGGLPGSYVYKQEQDRAAYLAEVYRTIVIRDLITKYNLSETSTLEKVGEFMMDNVGNITSPNGICGGLASEKIIITNKTVSNYLGYLCNAFVLYKATRYDVKGKSYLQSLHKYYLADTGLRFAILGRRNMDWGRMLENIVYIELLRRGYEVYVGKLYQKEIDFVASRRDERLYIQVSDNISDLATFEREISPLLQVRDGYKKMIIARTGTIRYDRDGVVIYDLAQWLLDID
jgi:hypothetical protein